VRNARQVSHPNVCRVYEIGEVNVQHFLTMEYIDGEDLASLLRRIGRLPADKTVETGASNANLIVGSGITESMGCSMVKRQD
jgi:serine/threonine protein kinase